MTTPETTPTTVTIEGFHPHREHRVRFECAHGVITHIEDLFEQNEARHEQDLVLPGLIDLQVNGFAGVDVMTCDEDEFHAMTIALARRGTTAFLPTLISTPLDSMRERITTLAEWLENVPRCAAQPLGLHLEGPFLAKSKRGAHPTEGISEARPEALELLLDAGRGNVRLVTLAPELPGADALIDICIERDIVVALGHSDATFDEAARAVHRGSLACTHFGNAMRAFHHREPGLTGAVLALPEVSACVIPDGIHVHDAVLEILHRAKGPRGVILVSDAIAAADLEDGTYRLANTEVTVEDGVCRNADGVLAGSSLILLDGVLHYARVTGAGLREVIAVSSGNAARLVGLTDRDLNEGSRADLIHLVRHDETWSLDRTIVGGIEVRP
ncbi:MAG: N-acetylglucosamine-6-phosphate deacetylase [Planctomycetes bacterium]|nr:N-acetylglucosamine-6-phosphate deacetylase [Planctomycetota bacterium]